MVQKFAHARRSCSTSPAAGSYAGATPPTWCWSTTRPTPCAARTCSASAAGRRSRGDLPLADRRDLGERRPGLGRHAGRRTDGPTPAVRPLMAARRGPVAVAAGLRRPRARADGANGRTPRSAAAARSRRAPRAARQRLAGRDGDRQNAPRRSWNTPGARYGHALWRLRVRHRTRRDRRRRCCGSTAGDRVGRASSPSPRATGRSSGSTACRRPPSTRPRRSPPSASNANRPGGCHAGATMRAPGSRKCSRGRCRAASAAASATSACTTARQSPHSGMDIAAPAGTPVKAPADGVISFADAGLYLTGGTLVLDHATGSAATSCTCRGSTCAPATWCARAM